MEEYISDDASLLASIGEIFAEVGDCDEAVKYFNAALERDSTLEDALQGLSNCGE